MTGYSDPTSAAHDPGAPSSEQLRKLYYSTTTHSTFVSKQLPKGESSFSDVHKAAQRVPAHKSTRAPFWSRDMTRYRQAYIPLPLDGAVINRELALTFHPDDSSSSVSRTQSVPQKLRTRYDEDFATNVSPGTDYRLPNFKPRAQKHVDENVHLLFTDSITHEAFPSHGPTRPRDPIRPPLDKPTNASAGFRFGGTTRYAEEYVDLSREGSRVEIAKATDDSSRVQGNSIPNRVHEFLFANDIRNAEHLSVSIGDILRGRVPDRSPNDPKKAGHGYDNPYLQDYLRPE